MNYLSSIIFLVVFIFLNINSHAQLTFVEQTVVDDKFANGPISTDVDNDGDRDILVVTSNNSIGWFENDGTGNFSSMMILLSDLEESIGGLNYEDLDGDGLKDLIYYYDNNKFAWNYNLGNLSFGPLNQKTIRNTPFYTSFLFLVDTDNDGDKDVVLSSNAHGTIYLFENKNDIFQFENKITIGAIGDLLKISFGDLNDDGYIDFACAGAYENYFRYCINGGDNDFTCHQVTPYALGLWVRGVDLFDIDGDDDIDLLLKDSNKAFWIENDGTGEFDSNPEWEVVYETNPYGQSFRTGVADWDDDGLKDFFRVDTNYIFWYKNLGDGEFMDGEIISPQLSKGFGNLFFDDLNGDADLDILYSGFGELSTIENLNGTNLSNNQTILTNFNEEPGKVVFADIDGDGEKDVISNSIISEKLVWYNNINGTFGNENVISYHLKDGLDILPVDIDGDGDNDIATLDLENNLIIWFENLDGQGNFSQKNIIDTQSNFNGFLEHDDIDGDGDTDILFSRFYTTIWYENLDGQGQFGEPNIISNYLDGVKYLRTFFDFDNDGDKDLVFTKTDSLVWFENNGLGTFGNQHYIGSGYFFNICAGDIDNDGDIDIVKGFGSYLFLYENQVDSFVVIYPTDLNIGSDIKGVYLHDLDKDGDLDLIIRQGYSIKWLENDGTGDFSSAQHIKNWFTTTFSMDIGDTENDGDLDIVTSLFNHDKILWYENLGTLGNEINGTIIADINNNGCDELDYKANGIMVNTESDDKFSTFSKSNGTFSMNINDGDFTTFLSTGLPDYYEATPNSYTTTFNWSQNIFTADFCLSPTTMINDVNVSSYNLQSIRPGFDVTFRLVYNNMGTTTLDGSISFDYPSEDLTFISTSTPIASNNTNSISFDYSELKPFENKFIDITFHVSEITILGSQLDFVTNITPTNIDSNIDDNTYHLSSTVVGSFDPNDINCLEGEEYPIENLNQYIHYLIRFQNTGTASAINVKVENQLDDKLDWGSLKLESSSHLMQVVINDGNNVSFQFNNINLSDSTSNELLSHGFVAYKIKIKDDVIIGDTINNRADIIFDFNSPILTNTYRTTLVMTSSIDALSKFEFSVSPNPTTSILHINGINISSIVVYNSLGKSMNVKSEKTNKINISHLPKGIYFIKVSNIKGDIGLRKIVLE